MEQIVNYLKELPTLTEGVVSGSSSSAPEQSPSFWPKQQANQRPPKQVRVDGEMYEQWPVLEFSDLNSSILDLFTKATSQGVSSALLFELTRSDSDENGSIRLNNEDHLKWCMQVLNHALTLSFSTTREYETLKGAVRIYLHWLRALCDTPDNTIPTPLLETPEKYFRNIIDAMRWIFCRRDDDPEISALTSSSATQVPRSLAVERQSIEIDIVLDALRGLTQNSSRKYQDEVWSRSLSFLLNSTDLLLAEPNATEEMGMRICCRVLDTLFELWLEAVLNEHLPSMAYWSTLAALTRRWRHNVSLIECWAKKILSFTVLVCKRMYGDDYLRISITDESVVPFGNVPTLDDEDENEVHLLYRTWYNLLCLLDSPARILSHDATRNNRLNGNAPSRTVSSLSHASESSTASRNVAFFLAATTLQRLVDIFYGDSRVSADLLSSEVPSRRVSTHANLQDQQNQSASRSYSSTLTQEDYNASVDGRSSVGSAGKTLEPRRDQKARVSERSNGKDGSHASRSYTETGQSRNTSEVSNSTIKSAATTIGIPNAGESVSTTHGIGSTASAPVVTVGTPGGTTSAASETKSPMSSAFGDQGAAWVSSQSSANKFVANFLSSNPIVPPYVGASRSRPKSERMLALLGDWLFEIVMTVPRNDQSKRNGDVADDVISGLSLHSVDLEDVPEAMSPILGRSGADSTSNSGGAPQSRRKSAGSSCSSVTGDSEVSQYRGIGASSEGLPVAIGAIDGVTAGRAAALATLIRIVSSKTSQERIPPAQLANFYATLFQALVEKDRLILCTLFYYGRNLFRLGLPGIEALLPHFLFALDIILIESSKLRLHPSISEVEMRRACLRALSSVVCWPTTFGMSKISQVADAAGLKSNAATYLHLRARIYKTLVFSLRNETDPTNLHIALALCTVLLEESCSFDLGLNEEQTKDLIRITTATSSAGIPEKGLCASFVRGIVSAVCDRICRPEWAADHSISLAVIDVLNSLSQVHHTVLFTNKDVSTGSLIVASLCRFIEVQLNKPPPMHSKDLHSTVVAAYNAIAVWLCAAPILAECESVLNTISEAIQLGVTGSKNTKKSSNEEPKKAASARVLEAAEYLMYSLFSVVGRKPSLVCDERRLMHQYDTGQIDAAKFVHVLINGDTLLSLHEASHIPDLVGQSATVIYVRRSPTQAASAGIAHLRANPDGYRPDLAIPPTPLSSKSTYASEYHKSSMTSYDTISTTSAASAQTSASVSTRASQSTIASAMTTGSIISGVSFTPSTQSAPAVLKEEPASPTTPTPRPPPPKSIGEQFIIPPEFYKDTCKLDTQIRNLESNEDTDRILEAMDRHSKGESTFNRGRQRNLFEKLTPEQRRISPAQPSDRCSSIRILLYDFGLVDEKIFGSEIVLLDNSQCNEFYRDLHEIVDCCPSRSIQTSHIFYVKEGQRSAVDILDNALNIQNTCSDFCAFLSTLGEGVEVGVHDSWTGHWSTAYSSDRKTTREAEAVDHYILDGVQHCLWWCDGGSSEMAFLMPTERSVRIFKQNIASPASSSRRGSNKTTSGISDDRSFDSIQSDGLLHVSGSTRQKAEKSPSNLSERDIHPYIGGGSSMGGNQPVGRRSVELRVMIVWLERAEDMINFPSAELLSACDDGSDLLNQQGTTPTAKTSSTSTAEPPAHHILFLHLVEPGIVQVRTRGTPNRFGEPGPLLDGMVTSLSSLASFVRCTLLNIGRRGVAEIDNYQFPHTKRKQSIVEFGKKYAANISYEEFLMRLIKS